MPAAPVGLRMLTLLISAVVLGSAVGLAEDTSVERFVQRVSGACLAGVEDSVTTPLEGLAGQLSAIEQTQTALPTLLQEIKSYQQRKFRSLQANQRRLLEQIVELRGNMQAPQQSSRPQCPTGWSHHGHSCFLVSSTASSWLAAHGACAALDRRARLASVHQENIGHIATLATSRIWFGLGRLPDGDSWAWADGTPLDIISWAYGQPDLSNDGGVEQCAVVFGRYWHDYPCSYESNFLCQIDLS